MFTPFHCMASHFLVTGHMWLVHRLTPNDLALKATMSKETHIYVTSVTEPSTSIRSTRETFLSYRSVQEYQMSTKWPWNDEVKCSLSVFYQIVALRPVVFKQCPLFSLCDQPFRVTGEFVTSAQNDPKWHWTLQGQRHNLCPINMF